MLLNPTPLVAPLVEHTITARNKQRIKGVLGSFISGALVRRNKPRFSAEYARRFVQDGILPRDDLR